MLAGWRRGIVRHRIPRPTSERQPDCVSHITIKGTLKTHTPLRNTKYGIGKTPRRTESHDGLGLALADPRHPLTLTIQTKAKRHQSLRRLRRRTPHTCRLAASPFHTHADRLDIGARLKQDKVKESRSIGILGIARCFEIARRSDIQLALLQVRACRANGGGGGGAGGKRMQVSTCGAKGWARVGEMGGIRCRLCTVDY